MGKRNRPRKKDADIVPASSDLGKKKIVEIIQDNIVRNVAAHRTKSLFLIILALTLPCRVA